MLAQMKMTLLTALLAATASTTFAAEAKPTIVLVHGAFADASSWGDVIGQLKNDGFPVVAVANPLRSVSSDADYVRRVIGSIDGPVVLVGHSYGGSVINDAADSGSEIKALVFVAAFAPERGETAADLSSKFPGSTLGTTLAKPVDLGGGVKDLYIRQDLFHEQFAADLSRSQASLLAATQRPIADTALSEPAAKAEWKRIPSWFVYGDGDKNIPPDALGWMAKRAGSRRTVVVKGASHVVMISKPDVVTRVIEEAASEH